MPRKNECDCLTQNYGSLYSEGENGHGSLKFMYLYYQLQNERQMHPAEMYKLCKMNSVLLKKLDELNKKAQGTEAVRVVQIDDAKYDALKNKINELIHTKKELI